MLHAIALCLVAAGMVACGTSPGGGPDGGIDATSAPDAGPGGGDGPVAGGLTFEYLTAPALPDVGAGIVVEEIRIVLADVRAIGDSAPGDGRTSLPALSLEWRPGDEPPRLSFTLAPPGIYSSLQARLGGAHEEGFEIKGRVRLAGGETRSFEIENDDSTASIRVDLMGLVVAGGPRTAVIAVSLAFLGAVPWDEIEMDDGELRIESGDPEMPAIVSALASAFSLAATR
jgi:hypothetical protein